MTVRFVGQSGWSAGPVPPSAVPPAVPHVVLPADQLLETLAQLTRAIEALSTQSPRMEGGPPPEGAVPPLQAPGVENLLVQVRDRLVELQAAVLVPRHRWVERDSRGEITAVHEQVEA